MSGKRWLSEEPHRKIAGGVRSVTSSDIPVKQGPVDMQEKAPNGVKNTSHCLQICRGNEGLGIEIHKEVENEREFPRQLRWEGLENDFSREQRTDQDPLTHDMLTVFKTG
jgi:hypothetical protein